MNSNEARKAAEVMLAYADGKEIEWSYRGENVWTEIDSPSFKWDVYEYRIKPEPKYRPFKDAEECWQEMQRHQPFGWLKDKEVEEGYATIQGIMPYCSRNTLIVAISKEAVNIFANNAMERYTFADGEPFGAKEGRQ